MLYSEASASLESFPLSNQFARVYPSYSQRFTSSDLDATSSSDLQSRLIDWTIHDNLASPKTLQLLAGPCGIKN